MSSRHKQRMDREDAALNFGAEILRTVKLQNFSHVLGRFAEVMDNMATNKTYKEACDLVKDSPKRQKRDKLDGEVTSVSSVSPGSSTSSVPSALKYPTAEHVQAKVYDSILVVHSPNTGGSTAVGYELWKEDRDRKIGIVVAGNSGRPGGNIRNTDGSFSKRSLKTTYSTQDEAVVSNWLLSSGDDSDANAQFARISFAWGLIDPEGEDTSTIQGVDYTKALPHEYGDAWYVKDVIVSNQDEKVMTDEKYIANLIFCAGPNAKLPGTSKKSSSMRRTYNSKCSNSRSSDHFFESQMMAVYASLVSADINKCEYVVVPHISGGIYKGLNKQTSKQFFSQLENLVIYHYLPGKHKRPVRPLNYVKEVHFVTLQ